MDEALEARGKARGVAVGKAEGVSIVLDLMAKGYGLEQIKEMLKT